MAWPSEAIDTTHVQTGTGSPQLARPEIQKTMEQVNAIRAAFSQAASGTTTVAADSSVMLSLPTGRKRFFMMDLRCTDNWFATYQGGPRFKPDTAVADTYSHLWASIVNYTGSATYSTFDNNRIYLCNPNAEAVTVEYSVVQLIW